MDTTPTLNMTAADRLAALRAAIKSEGLDGWLVPHGDEHQGEYVAAYAERLAWLTDFTGSAGAAIVMADKAAVFADGRYTIQVRDQVDGAHYAYRHLIEEPPASWIRENVKAGQVLGFDPRLHTPAGLTRLEDAATKVGATLRPLARNLVDAVWHDQPPRPLFPAEVYPESFAGRSSGDKRKLIAAVLKEEGLDGFFMSALDSIAWIFNIRGQDVECTPLVTAYALLRADGKATLLINPAKLTPDVKAHLGGDVAIADYEDLDTVLKSGGLKTVGVDRDTGSRWVVDRIEAAGIKPRITIDPCVPIKARKHPVELDGVRQAHVRDGAALTRFLCWFESEAAKGTLTEISASDKLEDFRRETNLLRGLSFNTIAGAGANGAIVHYRAMPGREAKIKPDMLFLLDSGGQYLDGTTDVTRTMVVGKATAEQKRRFTLVLKGHIALGAARFVKGTTGSQLDALARHALWQEGLDYDHGTGHGVGTYLGVHEGPQRISKVGNTVALEPGMVISNEPGYYKTGEYGIRIENLVAVREAAAVAGAEKTLLEFETLTLAPIDRNLIEASLLTPPEKEWLDAYHARVREAVSPLVDATTKAWLEKATAPV